jgi:hypothetical protein
MRLRVSANAADEHLVSLINEGYALLAEIRADYTNRRQTKTYAADRDNARYRAAGSTWRQKVRNTLDVIFPTALEANTFLNPNVPPGGTAHGVNFEYGGFVHQFHHLILGLDKIRKEAIPTYTDLPIETRVFVEDIDSFRKVRDVNRGLVVNLLDQGFFDRSEEAIQTALEQILDIPVTQADWGGEVNDLYSSNVVLNGRRIETAFMLKGNGLRRPEMRIRDCGANGDQLIRLMRSPARLFVVQYVGNISQAVIEDMEGKVRQLRGQGRDAYYCIIDGQDTARLMRAYGKV